MLLCSLGARVASLSFSQMLLKGYSGGHWGRSDSVEISEMGKLSLRVAKSQNPGRSSRFKGLELDSE